MGASPPLQAPKSLQITIFAPWAMNGLRNIIRQFAFLHGDAGWLLAACLLSIPAFFLGLDRIAFIGDEGIRTLVALEMKYSGNFIVPTLNGEYYYNKPPLFNWMIIAISEVFGHYGEWPTRTLNLFFLGVFAVTSFGFVKKFAVHVSPVAVALLLLTSGRILFWDSMFGLIDICFSWVVFLNFMLLYRYGERGLWSRFFGFSYALCAVAFMLKGLPALVFQAISVPVALAFFGALRQQFFSRFHGIALLVALMPVAAYYTAYASWVSLPKVFAVLTDQSLQRTATHHGWERTIVHIFTFPWEQLYHFLPWSLLGILFLHRRTMQVLRSNRFVFFNACMLAVNLPVYWFSVEVYPRYLLMFVPLFNVVALYFLEAPSGAPDSLRKWTRWTFVTITLALTAACFAMPLYPGSTDIPRLHATWIGASLLLAAFCIPVVHSAKYWILYVALFMLAVRVVFNLTLQPAREKTNDGNHVRTDVQRLKQAQQGGNWYIFGDTELHQIARFYTTVAHGQIIKRQWIANDPNGRYFVDLKRYPDFSGSVIDSLWVESREYIHLMFIKQ